MELDDDGFQPALSKKGKAKAKKVATYKPKDASETAKSDKDAFRLTAVEWIKDNESALAERVGSEKASVVCVMFFKTSAGELGYRYGSSGYPKEMIGKLTVIRETHGVAKDKATVCAEEHAIADYPEIAFLYSIAYHHEHGFIFACSAGCQTLLAKRNIEDLKKYV